MNKLFFTTVIGLLMLSTFNSNAKAGNIINVKYNVEALYKHLAKTIKYPNKARIEEVQGNSVILFNVANGKIENIRISTELGGDCDGEVINSLLSFSIHKDIKDGKYALKTRFGLEGPTSAIKNNLVKVPIGYTELNVFISSFKQPNKASNDSKTIQVIKLGPSKSKSEFTFKSNGKSESTPIYIFDDEILDSTKMAKLDPNTIKSINVFKGEEAIALYGKEATNGVIVINSKYYIPKVKK